MTKLWRSNRGKRKLIHYPKRSGRKTACGMHLMWEPTPEKLPPTASSYEHERWKCLYQARMPINTSVSTRFDQVTCPDCRRSEIFYQDLVQWELTDGVPFKEWDAQFSRG